MREHKLKTVFSFYKVIHRLPMPYADDEIHHSGWNACSRWTCDSHAHTYIKHSYSMEVKTVPDHANFTLLVQFAHVCIHILVIYAQLVWF